MFSMMVDNDIRKCVSVIVLDVPQKRVLLGYRLGYHCPRILAFPRGKIDNEESYLECAKRKLSEETGLALRFLDNNPCATTRDVFPNQIYDTFYFRALWDQKQVPILDKTNEFREFRWMHWEHLSKTEEPLFLPVENLIETGYNPFQ